MQIWFTVPELAVAQLPGLPTTKVGLTDYAERERWTRPEWENQLWRKRVGRGGGREFHLDVLPDSAKAALAIQTVAADTTPHARDPERQQAWEVFDRLPDNKKKVAVHRFDALLAVETLAYRCNMSKQRAVAAVCEQFHCTTSTFYRWESMVRPFKRGDWVPALLPQHNGCHVEAECSPEAWEAFKTDYLRLARPTIAACYRRLEGMAAKHGWTVPSVNTLSRRINALPPQLVELKRYGVEAANRMVPAQERDRAVFHALEAINADGHKWDVFVQWPDEVKPIRPMMVAIQDLYSGAILAWRVDKNANKEIVRLAIGDVVDAYGIPRLCYFDNGPDFASKQITGGARNRYRFKLKDDDPLGVLPQLGVDVHFTTPYHGQSKPIERAFRDFAGDIAKHPRFAGAYVGHKPDAKPEDYGSYAVPLDVFLETVSEGVREHNERVGRNTRVCGKRLSFMQAFAQSYAVSPITKATEVQKRLWLLAAEQIRVDPSDGSITLMGNRFWDEFLWSFRGKRVTVRFDPQVLQQPLHVYRADGAYLGAAPCQQPVGFADAQAAQDWARRRKGLLRATRELERAMISMSIKQLTDLLPEPSAPAPLPETKVVRPYIPVTRNATAPQPEVAEEGFDLDWLGEANKVARLERESREPKHDGDD